MKLFNNCNFKKYFSISLVLSLCMGIVGYFLSDKMLVNKEMIREAAGGPTVSTSTVFGSPLEIIISIWIIILIMLLLLYKPLKWGINKLRK
jgi:hypothetical protein